MLGTLASLGIGLCVDKVLEKAVPTVGMKVGEKILTKIGVGAISLAVGNEIDRIMSNAEKTAIGLADRVCGVEIIEPEGEGA